VRPSGWLAVLETGEPAVTTPRDPDKPFLTTANWIACERRSDARAEASA